MPKLAGRQRLRGRVSPDITQVAPQPVLRSQRSVEQYSLRRPAKVMSSTWRQQKDDGGKLGGLHQVAATDYNGDVHYPSSSKRLAQRSEESGEALEFSPNYDDPEPDGDADMDPITPFVQDMFFPYDTTFMEALGSLNPDPYISSSAPLVEGDDSMNDGLNTPPCRSPSPVTSPLVSPGSPDRIPTPDSPVVMYAPPEPEVSPVTRRSLRTATTKAPPISTPTKGLNTVPEVRIGKASSRKRALNSKTPSPERYEDKPGSKLVEDRLRRKRARMNSQQSVKVKGEKEEVPKSCIVPYVLPPPSTDKRPMPRGAIKGGDSPADSEKSFQEIVNTYVDNYDSFQRPGKIKRLRLSHFMCHDFFDEEWNQMVNYITADNGAGKSAILVALQLVFGAKASTTRRSTNAKDLIQYGRYQATIEVTLSNDGTLDIEKYGTEVVIIRTIRYNGVSWYSIRKGDGTAKRSLLRKELELIMVTLQIMVDNPAMILNQEDSRSFLPETNPRALYIYFYRGLNLEHCEILLTHSRDDIESARKALASKYKMLEELQSKAREYKSSYEAVVTLENGKERAQKLTTEYHWTIVAQREEELKALEHKLDVAVQTCAELEHERQKVCEQQNSLDTTQESSKSQLKKLKRSLHSKRDGLELKSREAHSHRQDLANAKSKLANLNKTINEKTRNLQSIEAEVARLREESDANYKERVRARELQKEDLTQQKLAAKKRLDAEKVRKEEAYTKYDQCNQAQVDWREKWEEIQFRIRERRHELSNIEKKQNSKYSRYGPEMTELITKIEEKARRGQFIEKPAGPQSACYTVKESHREYAPLIEHILGSKLFHFRVGHEKDKDILQSLIKEVYKNKSQPGISFHPMKSRERFKVPNVKAISGYDTVMDALDIVDDDPLIFNWLADSHGFEKILLFPTEREACNVMKEPTRHKIPRQCTIAYSQNFKRIHADPHFRSMVINPCKDKTTCVQITSTLPNDELLKLEVNQLEGEAQVILEKLEKAKKKTKLAKEADYKVDVDLKAAQNEVNSLEISLRGLGDTTVQGPDLASYIEDGEEVRGSIKNNMVEKSHLETKVEELTPFYATAESEKRALEDDISATENEIQTVENQSDFAKRANDLRIKFKNLNEELSNQNTEKVSLAKKVKETGATLQKSISLASSQGERVPKKRDLPAIKEELRCLEAMLHKNRHKLGRKGALKKDWDRAQEYADDVEQDIRAAGNLIDTLIPTITTQFRRFEKKKHDFGNTLQASFQSLISCRNFGGKLWIDHKARDLMFWVCPDTNSEERAKKKGMKDYVSGLSGGERSIATICFMVSMWKTMEAPFYILDEFDVFMDQANRKASQMILNAHTRSQPEAQFFFITPLKLDSTAWHPDNAKILRLYPPIRDANEVAERAAAVNLLAIKAGGEKPKRESSNSNSANK